MLERSPRWGVRLRKTPLGQGLAHFFCQGPGSELFVGQGLGVAVCLENRLTCCRLDTQSVVQGPASSVSLGSLSVIQTFRPTPDLLAQSLHFSKTPRGFPSTLV